VPAMRALHAGPPGRTGPVTDTGDRQRSTPKVAPASRPVKRERTFTCQQQRERTPAPSVERAG
jgi:hypothetical protein